jgi:hypothetical protein
MTIRYAAFAVAMLSAGAASAQCVNAGAYDFCQPGYSQPQADNYDAAAAQEREQMIQDQQDTQRRFDDQQQSQDFYAATHPRWGEDDR